MTKPSRSAAQTSRGPVKSPTTPAAVARVQSAVAKQSGRGVPKGSYVGRMQQTLAKTAN